MTEEEGIRDGAPQGFGVTFTPGRAPRYRLRMDARGIVERRRLSFGGAAALYDSIRPGYPREAAIRMLGPERRRVADIGAGTGILSRVLLELGHEVVAIEPDAEMRRTLIERTPDLRVLEVRRSRFRLRRVASMPSRQRRRIILTRRLHMRRSHGCYAPAAASLPYGTCAMSR